MWKEVENRLTTEGASGGRGREQRFEPRITRITRIGVPGRARAWELGRAQRREGWSAEFHILVCARAAVVRAGATGRGITSLYYIIRGEKAIWSTENDDCLSARCKWLMVNEIF